MGSAALHPLLISEGTTLSQEAHEYLALVATESYPTFIAKDADSLDLLAHLSTQMQALKVVTWNVPARKLNVRFLLTEDDRVADHVALAECRDSASGWLRTDGRLCFTNHDRLLDCARHRRHDLHHADRKSQSQPQFMDVPPGIYSVQVFYHVPLASGGPVPAASERRTTHYTVLLRHYAHPAPRLLPIRLPGFMPTTR